MKNLRALLVLAVALPGLALAATFNLFAPVTGILKGNASTYVTTAAASSDVLALWSGTCNSTTFLRGDGSCVAPVTGAGGSTTQVQYNNAGAFAGDAGMTYNAATDVLTVASSVVAPTIGTATAANLTLQTGGSSRVTLDGTTGGVVVGGATGGQQGAGTINAAGMFVNGVAVSAGGGASLGGTNTWTGSNTFANTTAPLILNNSGAALNAKNSIVGQSSGGSFYVQSATDAAPTTSVTTALVGSRTGSAWSSLLFGNATDNPTFQFLGTGAATSANPWTFSAVPTVTVPTLQINGASDQFEHRDTAGATDAKRWNWVTTATQYQLRTLNDAGSLGSTAFNFTRSGYPLTSMAFGNATDNPSFSFLGTGAGTSANPWTWTGSHVFNGAVNTTYASAGVALGQSASTGYINFYGAGAVDARRWDMQATGANTFTVRTVNDAYNAAKNALEFTRSGNVLTNQAFGNATDNPTFQFLGTGATSFSGAVGISSSSTTPLAVTGTTSASRVRVNDAGGTAADASIQFERNGVVQGYWGLSNITGSLCTGSSAGDGCIRMTSGTLRISRDAGATSYVVPKVVGARGLISASSCSISSSATYAGTPGVTGCTFNATGSVTLNLSGFTTNPICTANVETPGGGTAFIARISAGGATTQTLELYTTAGALVNGPFVVTCVGL